MAGRTWLRAASGIRNSSTRLFVSELASLVNSQGADPVEDGLLPEALTWRVRDTLAQVADDTAPRSEAIGRAAARVLRVAAQRAGERDHDVAFELLAADGLLTLACEDAAGEADPEQSLLRVLEHLVREIE